jgi:hypothetical protein
MIYLLIAACFSLPPLSARLQTVLNWFSVHLLSTRALPADHSLFQAGAFVLMLLMACYASRVYLHPEKAGELVPWLIGLDVAYAVAGLLFYLFSKTRTMHDLFAFLLFGALSVWTVVVYLKKPTAVSPV